MSIGLLLIVFVLESEVTLKPIRSCQLFGIDSLRACVRVDIEAYEIHPVFGIDSFGVVTGLMRV